MHTARAEALGALVTIVHHDHTSFRLPAPPDVTFVRAVTDDEVIAVLTARFAEFGQAKEFTVEVAEYLAGAPQA